MTSPVWLRWPINNYIHSFIQYHYTSTDFSLYKCKSNIFCRFPVNHRTKMITCKKARQLDEPIDLFRTPSSFSSDGKFWYVPNEIMNIYHKMELHHELIGSHIRTSWRQQTTTIMANKSSGSRFKHCYIISFI